MYFPPLNFNSKSKCLANDAVIPQLYTNLQLIKQVVSIIIFYESEGNVLSLGELR